MSQVCNNPIITFMSIVIISCDTTQVLYITRYCVYIYKDMTRHGATIRHIRKKLFCPKRKKGREKFRPVLIIKPSKLAKFETLPWFLKGLFYSLGYHIWTNLRSGRRTCVLLGIRVFKTTI